jgi:hypothetical protein
MGGERGALWQTQWKGYLQRQRGKGLVDSQVRHTDHSGFLMGLRMTIALFN